MRNHLVSIGIPTYNRPNGLKKALDCAIKQTYEFLEIIISDNCSTDPEVEQIAKYYQSKDSRIKYYRQEINRGPLFNFNFLVYKATGDFFKWLADDDWVDKNYIEECIKVLLEDPGCSGVYGKTIICRENGDFIRFDAPINLVNPSRSKRLQEFYYLIENNGCYSGLMRKENYKFLKVEKQIADDWLIVARIGFLGKFRMISETSTYITVGGVSQTIDSITHSLKLSSFTKAFPYLKVGLNIIEDIVWKSSAYKSFNFFKRIKLAIQCFLIIYKRFNVKEEFVPGIIKYCKLKFK